MSCIPALICLLLPVQAEQVQTPAAAKILPPSTAAFAEIPQPAVVLESLMAHPLHERLKQDETLGKLYASPQMLQARAGLAIAEIALGMKLNDAVDTIAGGGISVAYDPETNAAAAILRTGAPDKFPGLVQRLLKYAEDARKNNNQSPVESAEYRGVQVYKVDKAAFAVLPDAVIIVTEKELGKWILDAVLDSPAETFATSDAFRKAQTTDQRGVSARAIVNLEEIRVRGGAEALKKGTRDNPAAEFLFGGILENLIHTPFVVAELKLNDNGITLAARTPHDPEWLGEEREFYFGPDGAGQGPLPIPVESTILNISTYRDLSQMWLYAGDLFSQEVNDGFAQAETTLSTLFAGKDFVEEILGEIKPNFQFIVARQDFTDVLPKPALLLPSFAIVGELKDSKTVAPEFRRNFQNAIGFFNVVGAMEGNPQMNQDIMLEDGVKFLTASFVPAPEDKESTSASIHYNFSPSVAFSGDYFVFSSSLDLAKRVAAKLKNVDPDAERSNFDLRLTAKTLQQVLADNRGQLVSNNMIEEGSTRAEAEAQIDLLLKIVGWFDQFSATLQPADDELRLKLSLTLEEPAR